MAISGAFTPQTPTVAIVAGVAAASTTLTFPGSGGNAMAVPFCPPQARVVNNGTVEVYISFTTSARTAVIPVAGTAQLEMPVQPNSVEVFNINTGASLFINTISGTAAQPIYVTLGEGM